MDLPLNNYYYHNELTIYKDIKEKNDFVCKCNIF